MVYVNGLPVDTCEGIYVNGTPVQNVYVNGYSAYQSKCTSGFVFWSNASIAPQTSYLDCGSGSSSFYQGGFDVVDHGFRKIQWHGGLGWVYGAFVWSQNEGVGIGDTGVGAYYDPPIPYYSLNHTAMYSRNEGADESCSVDQINYDWESNTFTGMSNSSDITLLTMSYNGDQLESSGNAIRAVHWMGCNYCMAYTATVGDWCYATQV